MTCRMRAVLSVLLCVVALPALLQADQSPGDAMIQRYFAAETTKLHNAPLSEIRDLETWKAKRLEYREQLQEMLGLHPWPEKHDLEVTVTGTLERDGVVVENLHFQSLPGLYVTANLYRPAGNQDKLPAVLYVCGHGRVKIDGVSYGNKARYQHHGAWLARHGFVCLTIDSLELGEIEGRHKGTYSGERFWWNNRGYTSAGVEAWNSIRALDVLESRDDVDPSKLGVTGRSGGGAYSWWVAALDDRIQAAVPVAGVTDLENHVVDGVVEGHCDCMFWVNTYRHDYGLLPALVAPRPLMIANTDTDSIFPLDGVNRVFFATRDIYSLYGQAKNLGLTIAPGPHKDTQQLRVPAFHWLREHLQGESPLIDDTATAMFDAKELKVFDKLPEDEINTKIDETFVPQAQPAEVPQSAQQWNKMRSKWRDQLLAKSFRAWPEEAPAASLQEESSVTHDTWRARQFSFTSQENIDLPLLVFEPAQGDVRQTRLIVADDEMWQSLAAHLEDKGAKSPLNGKHERLVVLAPRGIGPTQWNQEPRKNIQIRRRFLLLGQTQDGMRIWDVRRAIQAVEELAPEQPLTVQADGVMAGLAVYAAIFEPSVDKLVLTNPPADHRDGPVLLNVRRFMNMPEAVAMAAEKTQIVTTGTSDATQYAQQVQAALGWPENQVQVSEAR